MSIIEKETPPAELENILIAAVKNAQAGQTEVPVVIAADKAVQYDQVINVMKQLQAAEIARVGLSLKVEK